ncbi:helix-turn-helix domain-containing protein [Pelagicoccus sp. SDUM812005]|uniref:helix-turn-helix domain-containing protein n=1 Tax=Pelagicoccus sp. SDUM812005 TaxID=3041257 RepID=UPI00280D161D|nr:helix-turn-helix domain-containing protein [Pelagicoccus sp. SDUM812005]MDQ8183172.1 helix-turn-helix domain-containing protein [Pelagicoccus sp. SDUM812005]
MAEYNIPNLRNACRLLLYLGEQDGEKSVTELAEALQLPRTSALRIVKTLESEGFLQDKMTWEQLSVVSDHANGSRV